MPDQTHIIQKSTVDLHFNGRVDGIALQKEMDEWCQHELLPLLDTVFQPYTGITGHIRIDRLEVNIEAGTNDDWKIILTQDLIRQLKEKLEQVYHGTDNIGYAKRTEAQSFTELLIFFLENGYLPWWSQVKSNTGFLELFRQWLEEEKDMAPLKAVLKNEVPRLRVAHHLPDELFDALIVQLNPACKDLLPILAGELVKSTNGYSNDEKKKVTIVLRSYLLKQIDSTGIQIRSDITQNILQKPGPEDIASQQFLNTPLVNNGDLYLAAYAAREANSTVPGGEAIFISNAGLVIVATFLPLLLERLGLLVGGVIIQNATALCLLHYLIAGTENAAEFELVLPKILCGMEVDQVVDTDVTLTDEEKTEANNLLLSVIEHWSILKNTSIDGLRETFLSREGKLSFKQETWLLQVEQKPYDMLLQHIPWNINFLKLSWMKHILRTEWV